MSYIECVDGTKYFPKHQDERIGRLELLARWIDEHGGRRPKTLDDIADVSYMPAKMRETNPYSYWGSIEEAAKKAGEHKLTGDEKYASKYEKREDIADSLVKESVDNHYSDTEISWINEGSIVALGISLEDVKFFFGNIEQLKTKVKSGVIPIRNKRRLKEKNRLKFESSHQGIASITIPDEIIKKLPKESPSSEEAPKPESEETSKAEPKKVSNPESEEKPQEMPKESNDDASQEDETSTLIREENTEFNVDDITDYVEYEVDEDLDEIVAEAEEAEAVVDKPEPESEPEETMEPEPEPEPEPEETKEPEPEPEDFKEPEPTPEPKKPTHYGPKPPKVELFANYIEYAKQNARVIAQTELRQLQKEYPGKYPNWDQLQKAGFISYYLDLILNLPFNEPRQRTRVESQRAEDLKKGTIPRIADINKILSTDRSKTYDVDEMTMGICWFEGKDLSAVGGEKTTTIKEVIEIKKGASKNVKKEVTPMKEESRTVNKQPEQVIVTNSTPIVSNSEANNTGVMVLNGTVKMVTYDVVTHTQITLPEGVEGITLTFPVTVTIKK